MKLLMLLDDTSIGESSSGGHGVEVVCAAELQ